MPEQSFYDHALPQGSREPCGLACEVPTYQRAQLDWLSILATSPMLADQLIEIDTMVCSADEIAALMRQSTNMVVRQALRMVAELREFTSTTGNPFRPDPASKAVLDQADKEWEQHLDQNPGYTKWLLQHSPVKCTRMVLLEAIKRAPTEVTRHAMREVLIFREAYELAHGHVFR